VYDWDKVRYTDSRKASYERFKPAPPKWLKRGVQAYELFFPKVFFLDTIMRVAGCDLQHELSEEEFILAWKQIERESHGTREGRQLPSVPSYTTYVDRRLAKKLTRQDEAIIEKHIEILDFFRALQLRARNGVLSSSDYEWMRLHMNEVERPEDFATADVFRLVATREKRDEINGEELRHRIEQGTPAIRIKPRLSAGARDDMFGKTLSQVLHLCIGARVMVTHNLCVAHGLVNGTRGIVHDIVVGGPNQLPVAVLIRVQRRTADRDGYSGPCFLDGEPRVDVPTSEVVVAIPLYQLEHYDRGRTYTCQQFPLMLAWAVTVHKSQGLTLARAVYDAGGDEWAVGMTFVALTRVRHPAHFALSPMPELARLTTDIAKSPALFTRKLHEHKLRELRYATAVKYTHLSPPQSAFAALPTKPSKYLPPPTDMPKRTTSASTQIHNIWQCKPQPPRMSTSSSLPRPIISSAPPVVASVRTEQLANLGRAEALQANLARVEALSLPSFDAPMVSALPSWLSTALPSLELRARIVDFWAGGHAVSQQMSCYLQRLGFQVDFVTNATQEPSACAFVAARVVNDLHAAGERWLNCDVRRAVEHQWVHSGNLLLGRTMPSMVDCGFMASNDQVDQMVEGFWQNDAPSELRLDCSSWFTLPGAAALDCVLGDLVEDLHSVATCGTHADLALRIRVPNIGSSAHAGSHWFTIAYSILRSNEQRAEAAGQQKQEEEEDCVMGDGEAYDEDETNYESLFADELKMADAWDMNDL
jgi:hypothetical protein